MATRETTELHLRAKFDNLKERFTSGVMTEPSFKQARSKIRKEAEKAGLDKDNIAVQVDGSPALVVSVAVLDSSTGAWQTSAAWGPGDLVRVTTEDGGSGWSYNDGDEVTLLVVCRSEPTRGVTGSDVVNEEVRLTHA